MITIKNQKHKTQPANYSGVQSIYFVTTDKFYRTNKNIYDECGLVIVNTTICEVNNCLIVEALTTDIYGRLKSNISGDDLSKLISFIKGLKHKAIVYNLGVDNFITLDNQNPRESEVFHNLLKASGAIATQNPSVSFKDMMDSIMEGALYLKDNIPNNKEDFIHF